MKLERDRASALVEELQRAHGAHTILLYGSLARGDATAESDVDVAAFTDATAVAIRDARAWGGRDLDAFVYPTDKLAEAADVESLRLVGAQVLLDARGRARDLLDRVAALFERGPPVLAEDDARMRRVWARKMLVRIGRDDLEARYRRHALLVQLLEDYFALRGTWYLGPKRAFADLAGSDPETHASFVRALAPGATAGSS